ncbi:MAG: 16S rRNA (adenine(1518)-N(6)/adenine(1519)-N(6))-dimethyltransferase RsmA [bacterium]
MRAKKSLGQNFLISEAVISRIIDLVDPRPGQTIVEIGPGLGALTRPLVASGATIVGVELDRDLAAILQREFVDSDSVTIVNQDILAGDPDELCRAASAILVGNLPYNITSPVLDWMFNHRARFSRAILMMQKEVAERVAGQPGSKNWAPLSIFLQCHFRITYQLTVGPRSFRPSPAVSSAVLEFVRLPRPLIDVTTHFETVVRQAFHQRRKMLINNLCPAIVRSSGELRRILEELGFDHKIRAEQLSIDQFHQLTQALLVRDLV